MLITWMAYATLFSAIVAGGTLALDRIIEVWGGARRIVWVAALLVTVVTPVLLAVRMPSPVPVATTDALRCTGIYCASLRPQSAAHTGAPSIAHAATPVRATRSSSSLGRSLDRGALALWALASAVLLGLVLRGFRLVARSRATWRDDSVDGHRVLLSDDVGPAVVGVLSPNIVLPRWVLKLNEAERAMMLAHEREHIRAGDPRLLLLSAIAVALFPWNAALWLLVQRLRLAVEIDCDARVLRAVNRPREYGMLLLTVGVRHTKSLPLAASLAERRPLLERRILAMTSLRPARPVLASIPFAAIVVLAVTAAAQTPAPAPLPVRAPALISPPSSIAPVAPTVLSSPAAPSLAPVAVAVRAVPTMTPPTPAIAPVAPPSAGIVAPAIAPLGPVLTEVAVAAETRRPASDCLGTPMSSPDVIRGWIAEYQPAIALGDTSKNTLGFVLDADCNIVATGAVYSPATADRLMTQAAQQAALAARGITEVVTPGRPPVIRASGTINLAAGESSPTRELASMLKIEGEAIDAVEVVYKLPGTLAPVGLGVIMFQLKRP
jgi:beta-lactamase regulating signal transducer with metallopeptidase domain